LAGRSAVHACMTGAAIRLPGRQELCRSGAGHGGKERSVERIRVYVNPAAGKRSAASHRRVAEALSSSGVASELVEVSPGDLAAAVRGEVARAAAVVGVAGGDGTLRAAAAELAGTATALAPFPTGTLNNFCLRMALPTPDHTARALMAGGTRAVRVGQAGPHLFLNSCVCGVYADVVRRREQIRHLLGKWPAAAVATLEQAFRLDLLNVEVEVGPDVLARRTLLVWCGMGRGSFPRTSRAEDGEWVDELELVLFRARTRLGALAAGVRVVPRLLPVAPVRPSRAFDVLHTRGLRVRARGRLDVTLDGEPFRLPAPLRIALAEAPLRVVAPAEP
jgi:diacylglycerol kinase family enzyme